MFNLKSSRLIIIGLLFFSTSIAYAETAEEDVSSGNDFYLQKRYDRAIMDYTKAINLSPTYAKAYDNRGAAYAQEDSLPRAIADFTMAIANNPKDTKAYNNRGHAYAQQGNLLQAVADYSKALDIDPQYLKAYANREQAYYQLKDYAKAWGDVFKMEQLGGVVNQDAYQALKQATGKDN